MSSPTAKVKRKPGRPPKKSAKEPMIMVIRHEILAVLVGALAVFLFLVLSMYNGANTDYQFIGIVGAAARQALLTMVGGACVFIPLLLAAWAYTIGKTKTYWSTRLTGSVLFYLGIIMVYSLRNCPIGLTPWEAGKVQLGGGYLGGAVSTLTLKLVGRIGTDIIIILLLMVGLMLITAFKTDQITQLIQIWNKRRNKRQTVKPAVQDSQVPEPPLIRTRPLIVPEVNVRPEKVVPIKETISEVVPTITEVTEPSVPARKKTNVDDEYCRPDLSLLEDSNQDKGYRKANVKDNVRVLEDTFSNFGVNVKVNQVSCGPTVTRYELQPAPGVKVSKIVSLTDDLQLSLAAKGIRIEAPIPGKSAVGIEVPNEKIYRVNIKELLTTPAFADNNIHLPIALGVDVAGNPVIADLTDMPHLLIAGATGSGKSVCLNTIIISLLYKLGPQRLKLLMIDPKMVELTIYNGLPHLLAPVVTEARKSSLILRWMVSEMERRYKSFAEVGARDIYRYNETQREHLPYIVVIIDELADLMMVSPVEVEDSICRLAQMARAAGIHLLVATQRPSVDVVTGIIKANMPSRIAFAVSSQADSRTILDMGGAEKLLGRGDMLFYPVGAAKPHRIQGAFLSDQEIEKVVGFINDKNGKGLEEKADELDIEEMADTMTNETDDALFWEAIRIFIDTEKASASLLQRKLRIGFTRAARLVDMMEDRGMVSAPDTNKKREILIDREQLERLMANRSQIGG
ncbi:MAG: DNA translocase FtsK 4TM domain-containing protein [Methylocystaceae bacterium]